MINKLLGTILMWLLGAPIYLPWLLARLGIYKRWYFAPFIPPFSWRRWIQLWPASAVFVCYPFIAISPLSDDAVMKVWAAVGVTGVVLALVMVLWNPRWAKPAWQRRLEDRFSHQQISALIRTWRKIPFEKWSRQIETEEGMLELVDSAIENQVEQVDSIVRLRSLQLANARERRLKRRPKWPSDNSGTDG